jgi:hypothetical protein
MMMMRIMMMMVIIPPDGPLAAPRPRALCAPGLFFETRTEIKTKTNKDEDKRQKTKKTKDERKRH